MVLKKYSNIYIACIDCKTDESFVTDIVEFFIEAKDYRPYKLHVLFKNQSAIKDGSPNNTIAEFLARILMHLENYGVMTIVHSTNDVLRKSIGKEEFKKSKLLNDNSIKLRCKSKGFNDIAIYSIKGNKLCFTTTSQSVVSV